MVYRGTAKLRATLKFAKYRDLTLLPVPANLNALTKESASTPAGGPYIHAKKAMDYGLKRKSGANPVRSRHCNWRDALPSAFSNAKRKPLFALGEWEGGEASISAISQEACQQVHSSCTSRNEWADLRVNERIRR